MLVEDASDVRSLVSLILSQAGYKNLKAGDGVEALDVASRHEGVIDVLVTDIVMPKMDGLQLADRLVALRADLKVLFVSGHAASAAVEAVMPRMHARFLQKPFSSGTLAQNLRSLLDTPHG